MERKLTIAIVAIAVVIIFVCIFIYTTGLRPIHIECGLKNGRIVNTLGEEGCNDNEINIGKVPGYRCPCICCVPKG
ncbi:hypothetical protein ACFL1B_04775 [Nanoarchaeota archaeon]